MQPSVETPISTGEGLVFNYYEGIVPNVNGIEKLAVKSRGVIKVINIDNRQRDTSFAFIFNGYLTVPKDGQYTFYLASNDGSVLIIEDHLFINNDGPHSMSEESASISLRKGKHKIDLKYFQMLGGVGLKLYWKGPGFDKEEIPPSVLSH